MSTSMDTSLEFKGFDITVENDIAMLLIDRPEKKNAMNMDFFKNLPKAIRTLDQLEDVRVIILGAKGSSFSAGLDLTALGEITAGPSDNQQNTVTSQATNSKKLYENIKFLQESISSVENCSKPVIAVVQGYCLGGGIDLITACDIRIGTADWTYSIREVKMAMVADLGTLQRLPRIISLGHINELALTGKDIDANYAKEINLINYVGKDIDEAFEYANMTARQIAANSPLVVAGIKKTVTSFLSQEVKERLEDVAMHNTAYITSNDLIEAVTAFFEKRDPKFTGS